MRRVRACVRACACVCVAQPARGLQTRELLGGVHTLVLDDVQALLDQPAIRCSALPLVAACEPLASWGSCFVRASLQLAVGAQPGRSGGQDARDVLAAAAGQSSALQTHRFLRHAPRRWVSCLWASAHPPDPLALNSAPSGQAQRLRVGSKASHRSLAVSRAVHLCVRRGQVEAAVVALSRLVREQRQRPTAASPPATPPSTPAAPPQPPLRVLLLSAAAGPAPPEPDQVAAGARVPAHLAAHAAAVSGAFLGLRLTPDALLHHPPPALAATPSPSAVAASTLQWPQPTPQRSAPAPPPDAPQGDGAAAAAGSPLPPVPPPAAPLPHPAASSWGQQLAVVPPSLLLPQLCALLHAHVSSRQQRDARLRAAKQQPPPSRRAKPRPHAPSAAAQAAPAGSEAAAGARVLVLCPSVALARCWARAARRLLPGGCAALELHGRRSAVTSAALAAALQEPPAPRGGAARAAHAAAAAPAAEEAGASAAEGRAAAPVQAQRQLRQLAARARSQGALLRQAEAPYLVVFSAGGGVRGLDLPGLSLTVQVRPVSLACDEPPSRATGACSR